MDKVIRDGTGESGCAQGSYSNQSGCPECAAAYIVKSVREYLRRIRICPEDRTRPNNASDQDDDAWTKFEKLIKSAANMTQAAWQASQETRQSVSLRSLAKADLPPPCAA